MDNDKIAFRKLLITHIMDSSSGSRLIAEPTPIPLAPAAIAMGAVTEDKPDEHNTGTSTAELIM